MKPNDIVRFKRSGLSDALAIRQSAAVGEGRGVVVSLEERDGLEIANVHFALYGAQFSGLLASDLEPDTPPAPRSFFGKVGALFGR